MGLGVEGEGEGKEGIVRNWAGKRFLPKENMNKMEREMNVLSNWDIRIRIVYDLYIWFGAIYWLINRKGLKAVSQDREAAIKCIFKSHDTIEGIIPSDPEPTFHHSYLHDLESLWGIGIGFFLKTQPNLSSSAEIALIGHTNV